jgi:LmbE family N-acetylglucosaminyl deacetylase
VKLPKLYDRSTLRRTAIAVGIVALFFAAFYAWQPIRIDLTERFAPASEPIAIERIGLFDKSKKVALVTAHPDDEVFYVGGTLAKLRDEGKHVPLIVLTDGDKDYYPLTDSTALAALRRKETMEVAERLRLLKVDFLGFPDGRLSRDAETVGPLAGLLYRAAPDIVLAFEPEFWPRVSHRDHRVAGEVTADALQKIGFTGWVLYFSTSSPNTFASTGEYWFEVAELLGVHESQFFGDKLNRIQAMVGGRAVEAGERFGVEMAEPFRAVWFQNGAPADPPEPKPGG